MSQGRKKPDKWKNILAEAEVTTAAKLAEVEALLKVQEVLILKQRALDQILESFAAVTSITSELGGCAPPSWCDVQQQLHACLGQLAGDRQRAPLQPHALEFLRITNNPMYTDQIRAMSDEDMLHTIRISMGKCAIMVLQDQGTAAWQQREHPASTATVSTESQDQQGSHERCSGHPQLNASGCKAQKGPRMAPAAGAVSATPAAPAPAPAGPEQCNAAMHSSGSAASASTALHEDAACGVTSCIPWDVGPAFEVSAIFAMLFNWDTDRFMRIASLDLETGQPLKLQHGPGFGKWLANRLHLTADQIAVLKGLRDLVKQQHEVLPATIHSATMQQQLLTQQQQQQVGWASNMHAAGQVLDAQQQVLQQQAAAVDRFKILANFMGLVTLNTLTPAQHAALLACSWPAVCRIEPVLDVLDDLEPWQG